MNRPPSAFRWPGRQSLSGCLMTVLIVATVTGFVLFWQDNRSGDGQRLPALELVPLTGDGRPVTLDDLKGKVVLVSFWATWCPPCRVELPRLASLRKEFASNNDFVLLAVSSGDQDYERLLTDTKQVLSELDLDLPTYADPTSTTQIAFRQVARFEYLPTSFVMDRENVIQRVWEGYDSSMEAEMRARIEQLLSQ